MNVLTRRTLLKCAVAGPPHRHLIRHVHNLMLDDPKETLVPLAKGRKPALRATLLWP